MPGLRAQQMTVAEVHGGATCQGQGTSQEDHGCVSAELLVSCRTQSPEDTAFLWVLAVMLLFLKGL